MKVRISTIELLLFEREVKMNIFRNVMIFIIDYFWIWFLITGLIFGIIILLKILEEKVILKQAIIIGVFQCLALWPGMSRSASTIMGAWIAGLSTVAAAEFSFFLAIPTMIGATAYKLISTSVILSTNEIITLIIGFIVAFLTAYIVVKKFIGYLKKHPLKNFAIYRMVVGIIILAIIFF